MALGFLGQTMEFFLNILGQEFMLFIEVLQGNYAHQHISVSIVYFRLYQYYSLFSFPHSDFKILPQALFMGLSGAILSLLFCLEYIGIKAAVK